jgi:hypothetical protein
VYRQSPGPFRSVPVYASCQELSFHILNLKLDSVGVVHVRARFVTSYELFGTNILKLLQRPSEDELVEIWIRHVEVDALNVYAWQLQLDVHHEF